MTCPHCTNSDDSLIDWVMKVGHQIKWYCNVCSRYFLMDEQDDNRRKS